MKRVLLGNANGIHDKLFGLQCYAPPTVEWLYIRHNRASVPDP